MTRIDDEALNAYIDGALTEEDTAAVAQAIARDKHLQDRIGALRQVDRLASDIYADIDRQPMPQSVLDLLDQDGRAQTARPSPQIAGDANVLSFPGIRQARQAMRRAGPLAALAASVALTIGFGAGLLSASGPVGGGNRAPLLQASAGSIEPGHPLHAILDEARSGERHIVHGAAGLEAQPLLSFRSKDGAFCREILVSDGSGGGARSLACKQGSSSTWRIVTMAAAEAGDAGGYAPASGEAPVAIRVAIDSLIAGDPLDAAGEARAIARNWQP